MSESSYDQWRTWYPESLPEPTECPECAHRFNEHEQADLECGACGTRLTWDYVDERRKGWRATS